MRIRIFLIGLTILSLLSLAYGCKKDNEVKVVSKTQEPSKQDSIPSKPDDILPLPDDKDTNDIHEPDIKEPTGAADDPFLIASASDWDKYLKKNATSEQTYYRLEASLTIQTTIDTFSGTLDGNGYTITINNRSLFKCLDGGTISNLTIAGTVNTIDNQSYAICQNGSMTEYYFSPFVCRVDNGGLIQDCDCVVQMDVAPSVTCRVAPFCGYLRQGEINRCRSMGVFSINNDNAFLCGIAVRMDTGSVIRNCGVQSPLSIQNGTVCGIVYNMIGSTYVENSYVLTNLSAHNRADMAGIANVSRGGKLDNCYFFGNVTNNSIENIKLICNTLALGASATCCYGGPSSEAALFYSSSNNYAAYCRHLQTRSSLEESGYYGTTSLLDELNSRTAEFADRYLRWIVEDGYVVLSYN